MTDAQPVSRSYDTRSRMARVSDSRPFKPYVYRGGDAGPPAMATALKAAGLAAVADTAGPGPDEAGYEWRPEQLLEDGGEWIAGAPADGPAAPPAPCERCGELEAAIDGLKATIRALTEEAARAAAAAAPEPPPAVRCRKCGYMTGTTGHRVMCDA